jgi:hypothetical protein
MGKPKIASLWPLRNSARHAAASKNQPYVSLILTS